MSDATRETAAPGPKEAASNFGKVKRSERQAEYYLPPEGPAMFLRIPAYLSSQIFHTRLVPGASPREMLLRRDIQAVGQQLCEAIDQGWCE